MKAIIEIAEKKYQLDLAAPLDISLPLDAEKLGANCFYASPFNISPVISGDFVGSTQMGGFVNFMDVRLNPHGNGTHTECVGHISKEKRSINQTLTQFHFLAKLITISPIKTENGDLQIQKQQIATLFPSNEHFEAIIIRTLPKGEDKKSKNYSGTNPCYIDAEAIGFIVEELNIKHLLVDIPSVDAEIDGGRMEAHKRFWNYPQTLDTIKTITELIYVDDAIPDGDYLLNLQIASFEMDASPSKPVIYGLVEVGLE